MVERHRVSSISRKRVMRGCYRGWTNGKIDVRVAVISVGSTKKHEHHWENVNVWTPDVVCTTRLGIQCRQFDPVSGPFSMNKERKDEGSVYSVGSQNHLVSIRSKQTYFKKRFQVSYLVVVILCLLVCFLFITVLVFAILYAHSGLMKICDSEDCMRIAASLKESMDTSVDPCDDFYQYACGRWPQEHPIPDSSLTNSWFSERSDRVSRKIRDLLKVNMSADEVPWAVMQAKTLFTSCMDVHTINELDLSPLFDLLELLNLPLIPAALTNKTTNYIEQMARVKRILGLDIFFGFKIMSDPRNNSRNLIYFDTPEHSSPFPSNKELEKRLHTIKSRLQKLEDLDDEVSENEDAELVYMTDVIKQVISNGTFNTCTSEDEFMSMETLEEFVEMLYEISHTIYHIVHANINHTVSEENLNDKDYMLVDDLQKLTDEYIMEVNSSLTPKPIWRSFIESLFDGIVTLDLDKKDKILVGNLDYLKDTALLFAAYEEEALESYIWWIVVDVVVPHSSEKLRNIWNTYVNKLMQLEIGESKSVHCASIVNQLMGMAVSWLFVDPTFHSNKAREVMEMLENIREAFALLVVKMDWMDQPTKMATLEKNRKMTSEIGFPEWLFDEKKLDEYYKGIDLSKTKYLDNMIQIIRLEWNTTWASLHDNNLGNESYWASDPIDVNAFHTFQSNHITVPIGILQFPFYELGLQTLNYGAIGSILGHELTHGFDNSGRYYDGDGNLREWWTNETISEYTERTQCFIDHYNTYYEDEIDDYIDGELTLGENIADNGGVREAFVAYEIWKTQHGHEPLLPGFTQFTHEQLFFLAFAHLWCESYTTASLKWMLEDTHCPAHVRLQAVLKNSKEFSTAWNCPIESKMNPSKKCHLW